MDKFELTAAKKCSYFRFVNCFFCTFKKQIELIFIVQNIMLVYHAIESGETQKYLGGIDFVITEFISWCTLKQC